MSIHELILLQRENDRLQSKLAEAEAKVERLESVLKKIKETHHEDCISIVSGRGDNWEQCTCHSKIANEALDDARETK